MQDKVSRTFVLLRENLHLVPVSKKHPKMFQNIVGLTDKHFGNYLRLQTFPSFNNSETVDSCSETLFEWNCRNSSQSYRAFDFAWSVPYLSEEAYFFLFKFLHALKCK